MSIKNQESGIKHQESNIKNQVSQSTGSSGRATSGQIPFDRKKTKIKQLGRCCTSTTFSVPKVANALNLQQQKTKNETHSNSNSK